MGVVYSISVLGDGESALNFLLKRGEYSSAWNPDLIFLDLNLIRRRGAGGPAGIATAPILHPDRFDAGTG